MASNPSGGLVPSRRSLSPQALETLKISWSRGSPIPGSLRRVGAGQRDDARPVAVLSGKQNGGQGGAEGIGKHRRPAFPGDQLHRALAILFFRFLRLRARSEEHTSELQSLR